VRPPFLSAAEWNSTYPPGTKVVLTLANGKRQVTRTRSQAESWGGMDHVQVECISQGYVPLAWVRPFLPTAPAGSPSGSC
jgi:hypothetical protein